MGYVEIAQVVFILLVFSVGIIGFFKVVSSDDKEN